MEEKNNLVKQLITLSLIETNFEVARDDNYWY